MVRDAEFALCLEVLRSAPSTKIHRFQHGLVIGAALFSAIGAGHLSMDGHGMLVAVGLQGLWFISVGAASLVRDPGQNS